MGDRANIVVKEADGEVWLYTHWGGEDLPETLAKALARKQRWSDGAYLARIIFCQMVKGSEDGETGFGISTRQCDNEHPILVVNVDKQLVEVRDEGTRFADYAKKYPDEEGCVAAAKLIGHSFTFDEFIKAQAAGEFEHF